MKFSNQLFQVVRFVLFFGFMFNSSCLFAQIKIEGRILGEDATPLQSASVLLLNESDSIMLDFALTNHTGKFRIDKVEPGKYILQISHLGYIDHLQDLELNPINRQHTVKDITMQIGEMKLDNVIITADYVPITMNHDTIQYNASAFKVEPNDVVEDLLKKLPGIEVSKDGTITAQGERVEKVLVEGKEFFGNDPSIATKNLPADAVAKIQVFDKKSELAEFAGIEDGMEQKTINLSLKDDRKKGMFGNGKAGLGTNNRYNSKVNVNRFSGDATMTAIGMVNNTNEQGFSVMDYLDFMGGPGNFADSDGNVRINSGDLNFPIGQGTGQGLTTTSAGGINHNYDFNTKTELSSSYFFNRIDNTMDATTLRQSLDDDVPYESKENTRSSATSSGHSLNVQMKTKSDSSYRIALSGSLGWRNGILSNDLSRELSNDDGIQNQVASQYSSDRDRFNFGFRTTLSKKLKKKGRILSLQGRIGNENSKALDQNISINSFYENPLQFYSDSINQSIHQKDRATNYSLGLSLIEPIGRTMFLEMNLNRQTYSNDFSKDFFDIIDPLTGQRELNVMLSDLYSRQFLYNRIGTRLNINTSKNNFMIGARVQQSIQNGQINSSESDIQQSYWHFLPSLRFKREFRASINMSLDYYTSIREPSLYQLQPQLDNTDPLYLYQGNQGLKPEYHHNLNLNYHFFSTFSGIASFASVELRYTKNKITNSQSIDENFVQTLSPVNSDRDITTSAYYSFSSPLRPLGLKMEARTSLFYNRGTLLINQKANQTSNWANSYTLSFENRKKEFWDWLMGISIGHSVRSYSKSKELNRTYYDYNYFLDFSKKFGDKWRFKTSMDYKLFPQEGISTAQKYALWEASISMIFLKKNRGLLNLAMVDILNQNKGISRTTSFNYFEDSRVVSLGRYAMISFAYSFSGFGAKQVEAIRIGNNRRHG